jgi:hypothetical protein
LSFFCHSSHYLFFDPYPPIYTYLYHACKFFPKCSFVPPEAYRCVVHALTVALFLWLPPSIIVAAKRFNPQKGYDPRRSKVSDDKMEAWRSAQITGDLTEVPGIGPAAVKKLYECDEGANKITNTYQLFGRFFMLKGPGHEGETSVEPVEHTQKFWLWLANRGISSHRSAIVRCIAEKSATFFNGIYDANDFEYEDDE